MMPVMDGFESVLEMRRLEAPPPAPPNSAQGGG